MIVEVRENCRVGQSEPSRHALRGRDTFALASTSPQHTASAGPPECALHQHIGRITPERSAIANGGEVRTMRRPSIGQRILVGRRYFLHKLNVVANGGLSQTADSNDMVRSGPPYSSRFPFRKSTIINSSIGNHQSMSIPAQWLRRRVQKCMATKKAPASK